jgi:hypothetical protein
MNVGCVRVAAVACLAGLLGEEVEVPLAHEVVGAVESEPLRRCGARADEPAVAILK